MDDEEGDAISRFQQGFSRFFYSILGWESVDESGNIFIVNRSEDTLVKFGSTTYSIIGKNSVYTKSYYDYFLPLAYLYGRPRVLAIGVGGGTVFLQLRRLLGKNVKLYGVDNSARMVEFARKYFIGKVDAKISIGDGAEFVSKRRNEFDLIFLDAYSGTAMPKQFFTDEFISNACRSLSGNGILAINTILSPLEMKEYVQRLREHFKVYELETTPFRLNVMLICSKRWDNAGITKRISKSMPKTKDNRFLFKRYSSLR
jgi:spermidine synthase